MKKSEIVKRARQILKSGVEEFTCIAVKMAFSEADDEKPTRHEYGAFPRDGIVCDILGIIEYPTLSIFNIKNKPQGFESHSSFLTQKYNNGRDKFQRFARLKLCDLLIEKYESEGD